MEARPALYHQSPKIDSAKDSMRLMQAHLHETLHIYVGTGLILHSSVRVEQSFTANQLVKHGSLDVATLSYEKNILPPARPKASSSQSFRIPIFSFVKPWRQLGQTPLKFGWAQPVPAAFQ